MDEITRAIRCRACGELDRIAVALPAVVTYPIEPVADGWGHGAIEDVSDGEPLGAPTYYCEACWTESPHAEDLIEVITVAA